MTFGMEPLIGVGEISPVRCFANLTVGVLPSHQYFRLVDLFDV